MGIELTEGQKTWVQSEAAKGEVLTKTTLDSEIFKVQGHARSVVEFRSETIASNTVAPARIGQVTFIKLDVSGASDTLNTVTATGYSEGDIIVLKQGDVSKPVTLDGGAGNMVNLGEDFALSGEGDTAAYILAGTTWYEIWGVGATATMIADGDFTGSNGLMHKDSAGSYSLWQTNISAAVDPAVTDDSSAGYTVGSLWINTTADKSFICVDASVGTAVWKETSAGAGGGISDVVSDTSPQLGGMLDVNGQAIGDGALELLTFVEAASAVNHVEITNAATAGAPVISSAGDDANPDLFIQAKGTGNIKIGNYLFDGDQTVSASEDNYMLTYDNASGLITLEAASGGGANTALSNLASVAINESLISDTNNTDDLGSDAIEWKDAWVYSIKHNDVTTPTLTISTTGNNGNIDISPHGSGNVLLGNYTLDGDQTVGAGQDNYVLTYDNATGLISLEAASGGGATTALDNLASVAINTSLISDTNNTDDLGSDAIEWKDLWIHSIKHNDVTNPHLAISTTGNNGNISLTPNGSGNIVIGGQVDLSENVLFNDVVAATGNEAIFQLNGTVNKATSGDYYGIDLNVTETAAPGSADRLLRLRVGGAVQFDIDNGGIVTTGTWQATAIADAYISSAATWNGKIANLSEDTTPSLGGDLVVDGFEIQTTSTNDIDLHSNRDIFLELGDAAGTNKVSIRDSTGTEQAAVDSDGNITTNGTVDGRDIATDGSKLDGIEALADVTDATNVAAAGAVMDGDFSTNGLMVRTGAGAYTNRSVTATAATDAIAVTNGDGVSGNVALTVDINALTAQGSPGSGDQFIIYDAGLAALRKIDWDTLPGAGAGANTALSNLASVAINESLVSDTNNTDDLGTDAIEWKDLWIHSIKHNDVTNPDLNIQTTGNNGDIILTPHGTGRVDSRVFFSDAVAATGDEILYDLAATVNKATSGNYFGIDLNVTETAAPGAADRLLRLRVGGAVQFEVDNSGVVNTGEWQGTAIADAYISSAATWNTAILDGDFSGNGFMVRTASGTYTNRSITNGQGISINNQDGVAGNPVVGFNFTGLTTITGFERNADLLVIYDNSSPNYRKATIDDLGLMIDLVDDTSPTLGGQLDWAENVMFNDVVAATGNETLFQFNGTVNKATSGDYYGLDLNVTETAAPGAADRLMRLRVGGTPQFEVDNGGIVTTGIWQATAIADAYIASAATWNAKANQSLNDLASVAINTSLISDTDNTDDLGTDAIEWKDLYVFGIKHGDAGTPALNITTTSNNGDINLTPNGTGNVSLGNYTFDADQTVGAGQDNFILTYDNGTGLISLEAASGGGANTALSNLASVAINTSLISDANNTDDLGSDALEWKDVWTHEIKHNDVTNPDLTISTTGNNGNIVLSPNGTGRIDGRVFFSDAVAATGDEILYDLAATVNKATSGNYYGLDLNVTETAAPGAADRLLRLRVGGTAQFEIDNAGIVTNGTWQADAVADAYISSAATWNAKANNTLNDLGSTAVNTSIISDTDNTDDLGSDAIEWKDVWAYRIAHNSAGTPDLQIQTTGNNGNIDLVAHGTGIITTDSDLNVTGNIIVSGTVDGRDVAADGTKLDAIVYTKSIVIEDPVAADNFTMFFTDVAITITQLNDVIQGSTNVAWNIKHDTSRAGAGNNLFSADRTTSSTTGAETTTFNDATVPAGSWVWYDAASISGTPDEIAITIEYTID